MAAKRSTSSKLLSLTTVALLCPTPCHASDLSTAPVSRRRALLPPSTGGAHQSGQYRDSRAFIRQNAISRILPSDNDSINIMGQLRGGAASNRQSKALTPTHQRKPNNILLPTAIAVLSITILFSLLNWETLVISLSTFFDREKFRSSIINTLNSISAKGTQGLLLYTFGFIFWETCGLPTSVVETAAGMAFGFKNGLFCSFVGKTLGSVLAFVLGRSACHSLVKKQLEENEVLELMEKSVALNPIRSAMIIRYSPFPQLIKNFGLSMMEAVNLPVFLMAICVHGFPFSVLWASLGYDSSLRLRAEEVGEGLDVNWVLNGALVFVTVFGFVVSPLITGWWLAGLRKEKSDRILSAH